MASMGNTLVLTLADSIVGAVVVRNIALVAGSFANVASINPLKSHLLANNNFKVKGISRLVVSKRARLKPSSPPGIGSFSSLVIAAAKMPTAVWLGGMDECPPAPLPTICSVVVPFSATLTVATNLSIPGKKPSSKNEPSSNDQANCTPLVSKKSATKAAPLAPPISSSCPKLR
ncbi:MAG: Uncharacterised protein [Porticoccaceae bacterium UBA1117]|nr:MAG: Uncharacterised protein [Porticoccaceae bacterium UBA1117]